MIVNEKIAIDHGLKKDEYKKICELLKRTPNITELGIFSAMWNEHCSYKSSRLHLKKLPTKGKQVIQGPGENAGVVDIGDNDAIVFKIESHNHPSFIEPYQGAATGVGGIMTVVRDFCGHGISTTFHESPNILHYGSKNTGMELRPGMTFTIEPMINSGKYDVKMLNDGWTAVTKDKSLSAQFEHTLGITENGYEIFTESAKGYSKPPYL